MNERIELLEARLARAEKTARVSAMIAAATVALALAVGCGSNSFKTLKAERIEVIDKNGKTVGLLFGDEQGGGISFNDADGRHRIKLAATNENPRLEMYDIAGKVRVTLNAEGEGSALALCDTNGTPRASLLHFDDQSLVSFFDADGKLTMKIPDD